MRLAFSGTRVLTTKEEWNLESFLITCPRTEWLVGDAPGVDETVRNMARHMNIPTVVFYIEGTEQWHFAKRTKTMIKALSKTDKLIAFPNKKCPEGCFPSANPLAQGSGTWLAIAYAFHHGIECQVLNDFKMPWTDEKQLTLF